MRRADLDSRVNGQDAQLVVQDQPQLVHIVHLCRGRVREIPPHCPDYNTAMIASNSTNTFRACERRGNHLLMVEIFLAHLISVLHNRSVLADRLARHVWMEVDFGKRRKQCLPLTSRNRHGHVRTRNRRAHAGDDRWGVTRRNPRCSTAV
eukprot:1577302-Rhodomonas_salina.1